MWCPTLVPPKAWRSRPSLRVWQFYVIGSGIQGIQKSCHHLPQCQKRNCKSFGCLTTCFCCTSKTACNRRQLGQWCRLFRQRGTSLRTRPPGPSVPWLAPFPYGLSLVFQWAASLLQKLCRIVLHKRPFPQRTQKLRPSTKPLMLEAGLFSDTNCWTNSSTISVDSGNGHMPKYLPLYHLTNCRILVPLRRTVPWLLLPKRICISDRRCSLIAALRSKPLGQASLPLEKIKYHFSKALVIAASSTSCSVRVVSKLITSLYTPLMVLPRWRGAATDDWLLCSENSMGVITGSGMSLAGSLLKILASPLRSQGIWNLKVGLTDKQASSIIDFKFLLSVSFKIAWRSSVIPRSTGEGTEYSSLWAGLSRPNKLLSSAQTSLSASKFSGKGNWTVLEVMDSGSESFSVSGGRLIPLLMRSSRISNLWSNEMNRKKGVFEKQPNNEDMSSSHAM